MSIDSLIILFTVTLLVHSGQSLSLTAGDHDTVADNLRFATDVDADPMAVKENAATYGGSGGSGLDVALDTRNIDHLSPHRTTAGQARGSIGGRMRRQATVIDLRSRSGGGGAQKSSSGSSSRSRTAGYQTGGSRTASSRTGGGGATSQGQLYPQQVGLGGGFGPNYPRSGIGGYPTYSSGSVAFGDYSGTGRSTYAGFGK
jgi:hypothetical protein